MKVLGVIFLFFAYVAARGSGPYLPSGWKPDGPAFYLPSEVSKPLNEPLKDDIFSESEASGSDFLREYGPPKVEEVRQDISQQGLPDVVNEQLFIQSVDEDNDTKEKSDVIAKVTEQKLEEVKAVEDVVTITESVLVTATEPITNIEEEIVQVNDETTTLPNAVDSNEAVEEYDRIVEPTLAIVIPTEKITTEANTQSENQILGEIVEETEQLKNQQEESNQSIIEVEKSSATDVQIISESQPVNSVVNDETGFSSSEPSDTSVTQQTDTKFNDIFASQERVETIEKEMSTVANIVQNIPDLIAYLEEEIKSEKTATIQEAPVSIQGSLDQAPEGFLEYGPPGFREYGPPKEDLRDNSIEEKIPEVQSIENSDRRRRRFSPKFRSSPKSQ